jgi:hypothetical protein
MGTPSAKPRSGGSASRVVGNRSRDLFKQKLEFTTVDPVAFHDKPGQGIVYKFSERTLSDVHDVLPNYSKPFVYPASCAPVDVN